MRIRTYRAADEAAVLGLWERAGIGRPWLDLAAEIREKRRRDRSLFLVAEDEGRVAGCVMGAYDGRRGWIYHLAVETERQRAGIGRALMAEVERRMRRLGAVKVNLQVRADNPSVLDFYGRLGYAEERLTSMGKWLVTPTST